MAEYSQTYWNELIDQYRNGTISDQNRYQLEKQALDDPFLFDALEGFSLYEAEEKIDHIDKKPAKIFTLPRMAAAASIILLFAFIFNMKMNTEPKVESDDTIAMVKVGDKSGEVAKENEKSDINSMVSSSSETEENNATEIVLTKKKEEPKWVEEKGDNDGINMDRPAKMDSPKISKPVKDIVVAQEEKINEDDLRSNDFAEVNKPEQKVDELVKEGAREEVAGTANEANLESMGENEDLDLGIPVATSTNAKKDEASQKRKKSQIKSYFEAVPVIGKEIFDDYAKERIDKRGLRQAKPQEVTIEFTIDKNGNLTNFHHIYTGCPECGPFAISILQNSGEWKTVPPGFSGKARYTFMF